MSVRRPLSLVLLLAAAPATALGQTGGITSPAGGSPAKTVEEVTVTAPGSGLRTSIDRRSYSLAKDLQAAAGSLADALRNLPAVAVDAQGGLTLRGDPNVTILMDGKPAPRFDGAGRADALQQLSADQIERVEVITNPSAALTPDGSAGVINLVSKTAKGRGLTRSVYSVYGSAGVGRLGATAGYNSGRLSATANVLASYTNAKGAGLRVRTYADAQDIYAKVSRGLNRNENARLSLTYDLDPKTQISGGAETNLTVYRGHPQERLEARRADGSIGILDVSGLKRAHGDDLNLAFGARRKFSGEGHELTADLTRNRISARSDTGFYGVPSPPGALQFTRQDYESAQVLTELKVAYARPLPGDAKLKVGIEARRTDKHDDNRAAQGASPERAALVTAFSNLFRFDQTIRTAYATYERPFGDLTVQAGVRLEDVRIDLIQAVTGRRDENDYAGAYPSLHLAWRLDEDRQLTVSYSRRIQRPPPSLMNPFRTYAGSADIEQGNPRLKPQTTDAYEAGYQLKRGPNYYLATAYYRRNAGELSAVLSDLGNGVVLIFPQNLGRSERGGLELTANGRLSRTLGYNASGNLYWSRVGTENLGFAAPRAAFGSSGRISLDWQAGADDLVQFNAVALGKRLVAQGYVYPSLTVNLGWRRRLGERATLVVTAQDVLGGNHYRQVLTTPSFIERARWDPVSRALTVRLDYRFGGGKAREVGFEYDAGAER